MPVELKYCPDCHEKTLELYSTVAGMLIAECTNCTRKYHVSLQPIGFAYGQKSKKQN